MGFLSAFFVTPLFLIGAVAAVIPVILHLIYRKRAPMVMFSTLRFLRVSVQKTAHRRRLQELLLLALRSLVLFLLAMALAGPFIRSGMFGGKGSVCVALVLDNSYSMATQHEGRTRYSRAKDIARRILKSVAPGSSVVLIFTNRRAPSGTGKASLENVLTTDINGVSGRIAASEVSAAPGDLAGAIQRAQEILQGAKAPNRELYVITDMQKASWRSGAARQTAAGAPLVPAIVVNCGGEDYRNLAVAGVAIRAKGRAVGVPITIEAKLLNCSSAPRRNVSVSLYVDKTRRMSRTVNVGANATTSVSFTDTFQKTGTRAGWVQVEADDSLEFDNRRCFAFDVAERIQVLVVRDRASAVPVLDQAFYLVPALNPAEAGTVDVRSVIKPTQIILAALQSTPLARYSVVLLVNIRALTVHHVTALAGYLKAGGNVVVFLGDAVDPGRYNSMSESEFAEEGGLLPANLGEAVGDLEDRDKYQALQYVDFKHPIFAGFKGLPMALFEGIHAYRYFPLKVPHGSATRVLAAFKDGSPFLVERAAGSGRVLMFCVPPSAPPTTRWTNLSARTLFLPLMHQLVYYLVGMKEHSAHYVAGSPARIPLAERVAAAQVEVTDPLGRSRRARTPAQEDARFALFDDTFVPGVYTWHSVRADAAQGAFVVNPHPDEADLAPATQDEVAADLTPRRAYFASDYDGVRKIATRLREGIQLWNIVLFVVLAIAVAECFLANRAGRRTPTTGPAAREAA